VNIHSLYLDFFKFLEELSLQSENWKAYTTYYYQPHRDFLDTYFSHFLLMNFSNLSDRVEAIKLADYAQLKNLVLVCPPEKIIEDAYKVCREIVSPQEDPDVYLIVGFFSPDGFVMNFQGKPVICFGMERFRDFNLLRILFAHEYAHYLLNWSRGEIPEDKELKWLLISEGIGTCFSQYAFPDYKLSDHLLFRRDRLNWCQENESLLRKIFCSGKYSSRELMDFYAKGNPGLNLPPRVGKYLGYLAVKKHLEQMENPDFGFVFIDRNLILSIDL
jgi:hypothetical protein